MMVSRVLFFVVLMIVAPTLVVADTVAELYQKNCAACHGENGDGQSRARYGLNPPPRDFTTPRSWDELTPERMRTSIRYGRPGTGMVAWEKKLTLAEIDSLVRFIRQEYMREPVLGSLGEGLQLYKKHCSACHGDKGNGAKWTQHSLNPSPRDFTTTLAREELSLERMLNAVTHGRPDTAMMSFTQRLSTQQIATVVAYIRNTFMLVDVAVVAHAHARAATATHQNHTKEQPAADMTLAFPHALVGDVQRGRVFFQNNCFTCHGKQGLGDGPRASFISPRPRNFTATEARRDLNRPALFRAIARGKQGTVMPAWATVLDNQQIVDVGEYVFQTFILGKSSSSVAAVHHDSVKKKTLNGLRPF